jgi:hypothetical protein
MKRVDAALMAARWIARTTDAASPNDEQSCEQLDPEVVKILRGMSGMERLRLAHDAWELARDRLTAFFVRARPEWSPERIRQEVAARLAGDPGRADAD